MFPRRCLLPLAGALALLSACGAPPQAPPSSPQYTALSAPVPAVALPSAIVPGPPAASASVATNSTHPPLTYPTYPGRTVTTTPPVTISPTPTPSHAPRCVGSPTGTEILNLIEGQPGIPTESLAVHEGPYCAGDWSFTTVEVAGKTEDELEPLMVVTTGRDSILYLVAAGSEVCTNRVQTSAPPGIRVLACGF